MNQKKQLLAVLLFVFVGAVIFSVVRFPRQQRGGTATAPPSAPTPRKSTAAAPTAAGGERLRLDLFEREQQSATTTRRNIFSPIFRDEVKAPPFRPLPPPPRPLPLPPQTQPVPVPPPQMEPPPPQPPAPPPMPTITFLGFLKKGGEQRVFISVENQIHVVKQGSIIAGKYQVTSLTNDAITITARSGGGETVIPLVESSSLTPRSGRRAP